MILFLDFDGVLHPSSVFLEKSRPVLHGDGELFMWTPQLIEALAPYPNVKIVLSTNWVRIRGFSRVRGALPESLQHRVIGATWHSSMLDDENDYDNSSRFKQIAKYVSMKNTQHWLAIDDLHEHSENWGVSYLAHLVKTNPQLGLSDPATLAQLKEMLSRN